VIIIESSKGKKKIKNIINVVTVIIPSKKIAPRERPKISCDCRNLIMDFANLAIFELLIPPPMIWTVFPRSMEG